MPTLVKISDLASQPALTSSALLEVEQGGISYKATVQQLLNLALTGNSGSSGGSSGSAGITTGPMTIGAFTTPFQSTSADTFYKLANVNSNFYIAAGFPRYGSSETPYSKNPNLFLLAKATNGVAQTFGVGTDNEPPISDAIYFSGKYYLMRGTTLYIFTPNVATASVASSFFSGLSFDFTRLVEAGGFLWAIGATLPSILKLDPSTASLAQTYTNVAPDSALTPALATDGTTLFYAAGSNVYTFNTGTGASAYFATVGTSIRDIKYFNNRLYVSTASTLWILNSSTGTVVTSHSDVYSWSYYAYANVSPVCIVPDLSKVLVVKYAQLQETYSILSLNTTTGAIDASTSFTRINTDFRPWSPLGVLDGKLFLLGGQEPGFTLTANPNTRVFVAPISFS